KPPPAAAAQIGRNRAEASGPEPCHYAVPGANVVRPAMQEDQRRTTPRPPLFVGDIEQFGLHELNAVSHRSPRAVAIAHALAEPPNDEVQWLGPSATSECARNQSG